MEYEKEFMRIKELLQRNPRGLTITDISKIIDINRNSVARYMDILTVSGQVEMRQFGPAKVYYISQRVPISALLNFSSDYILLLDSNLKIIQVSENLLELVNIERDATLGQYLEDLSNPLFTSQDMASKTREALSGKEVILEEKFQVAEVDFYFNIRMLPTTFEDGTQGVTWILQDITERKKAEESIRRSEKKYLTLFNDSNDGLVIVDRKEGDILDCNPEFMRQTGRDKAQLLKMKIWDIRPPKLRETARRTFLEVGERGYGGSTELDFQQPSGKIVKIGFESKATIIEGREVLQSRCRDITDRKQAEEQIQNLAKFPSENPNPVLRIAKDGEIMYANNAGFSLLSNWNREIGQIAPPKWQQKIGNAFSSNERKEFESEHDGRYFSFVLVPVTSADYVNIYGRDVTERKSMEETLKETNWKLRERVKRLTFLYRAISEMQMADSLEDLGPKLVDFLVPAMQFPEIAAPVVEIEGKYFAHQRYRDDLTQGINAEICVSDRACGHVAVYYTEDRPFIIPQEQNMLNALAESLSVWLTLHTRKSSSQKSRKSDLK